MIWMMSLSLWRQDLGRENGGERRENKVQGISFYPTVAIEKPRPEIKDSH